jgi:3-oxoacyl-[acyl-carrier-protein] synthase II
VTRFDPGRYAAKQAAEVLDVPPDPLGEWGTRAALLARAAADEALAAAGVFFGGPRDALVAGTTLGENEGWTRHVGGDEPGSAGALDRTSLHSPARALAGRLGVRGRALTVSVACASGTAAVGLGADLIRRGEADRVLAGGFDALSEFVFSGFDALRALSPTRVRPFDARRDGLGLGEGAAFLVLEEEALARRRGAPILARVLAYASASDAHHMTRPSAAGDGVLRAVRAALCRARLGPDAVDFVNAHGTATTFNDRMEAAAFRTVFGGRAVPVNSIKSAVGHTLGAAGALEAVLLALVLTRGAAPGTVGFEEPDPACPLDVLPAARRLDARVVLSTSSAFAGTNAALLLGRC